MTPRMNPTALRPRLARAVASSLLARAATAHAQLAEAENAATWVLQIFSPALLLAVLYAYQRDRLDEKYGIEHNEPEPEAASEESAAAADGGERNDVSRPSSAETSNGGEAE